MNESDKESGMCSESGDSGQSETSSGGSDDDEDDKKLDDDKKGSGDEKEKKKVKKKKKVAKHKSIEANKSNENVKINKQEASNGVTTIETNATPKQVIQIPKRVQSIFFKNLPVNTSRLELEEVNILNLEIARDIYLSISFHLAW